MADAYGAIVVGFSDDFEGDVKKLADTLNQLELTNLGEEFHASADGISISSSSCGVQYPTLAPTRDKLVSVMEGNQLVTRDVSDLSDADWDNVHDFIQDERIPLEEIAGMLASDIKQGSIHLSCCSNEKQRSVDSAYLRVSYDGSAERALISHWVGNETEFLLEHTNAETHAH